MLRFSKIIAAVLVLLAIALAGYAWMLSRQPAPAAPAAANSAPKAQTTYPVVVATKPLPAGKAIEAGSLQVAQLTINPSGAFKDIAAVAGRVPVLSLGQGSPLLEGQLVSGLALRLEAGERAVAVKADEVMGVGNNVRPGDFVDVFFALKADGKDIDRSQVRLLLSRKRVLAFGSASLEALPADDGAGASEGRNSSANHQQRQQPARTVVLAVPVDDVNRLTLGEASGRLLLALRHPTDTAEPDPALYAALPPALQPQPPKRGEPARPPLAGMDLAQAGLTTADLVAGGAANARRTPAASKAPAVPRPARTATAAPSGLEVEVIRGERSNTVRY